MSDNELTAAELDLLLECIWCAGDSWDEKRPGVKDDIAALAVIEKKLQAMLRAK